jgi:hypothetical protein
LYWTGGANPPDDTYTYDAAGLRVNIPNVRVNRITLQISQTSTDYNDCYFTYVYYVNGHRETKSYGFEDGLGSLPNIFTVTYLRNGFAQVTFNASQLGGTGYEFYFTDFGNYDEENESFQDYITRVYVNDHLATPLLRQGFVYDCTY